MTPKQGDWHLEVSTESTRKEGDLTEVVDLITKLT